MARFVTQETRHFDMLTKRVALPEKRVLDIGCGKGALVAALAAARALAVGLEPQAALVQEAWCRSHSSGCLAAGCLGFVAGDASALPFVDRYFDLSLFFFSLHHIPQAQMKTALCEAQRVTRKAGLIYVAEPIAEGKYFELTLPVHDERQMRSKAAEALAQAEDVGLRNIDRFTYRHPMSFSCAEHFLDKLIAPDPKRKPIVEALRPHLIERFHRQAERQGDLFVFLQPVRVNLFSVVAT